MTPLLTPTPVGFTVTFGEPPFARLSAELARDLTEEAWEHRRACRREHPEASWVMRVVDFGVAADRWREGHGIELLVAAAQEAARRGCALVPTSYVLGRGTDPRALRAWQSRRLAQRVTMYGMLAWGGEQPRQQPQGPPCSP